MLPNLFEKYFDGNCIGIGDVPNQNTSKVHSLTILEHSLTQRTCSYISYSKIKENNSLLVVTLFAYLIPN